MGRFLTVTYTWARRCTIALIGGTVIAIGVLMIVLPGPAFIVIPAGLAILGLEFAFARRWLRKLRATGTQVFGATVSRWFRKQPRASEAHGFDSPEHPPDAPRNRERRYKYGAEYGNHALPPYARGQLTLDRARAATISTKTSYSRGP